MGGPNADLTWPAMASDPDGNFYVAGLLKGTVDFGTGLISSVGGDVQSGFIVAFDPTGTVRWARAVKAAGGLGFLRVSARNGELSVSAVTTGAVELGSFMSDPGANVPGLLVARLRAQDGVVSWGEVWSNGSAIRGAASLHAGGDLTVRGHFAGSSLTVQGTTVANAAPSGVSKDLFAARLDSAHALRWLKPFGDGQEQVVYGGGTVDQDGNSVLMSTFAGQLPVSMCPAQAGATAVVAKLDEWGGCQFSVPFLGDSAANFPTLWYAAPTAARGTVVAGGVIGTVQVGGRR
ncbi:MAG: hypothetical protein AB1938_24050 [Myxococcota bacterium]